MASATISSTDTNFLNETKIEELRNEGTLLSWVSTHPTKFDREVLKGTRGTELQDLANCAFWDGNSFLGDSSITAYLKAKSDLLEARNNSVNQRLKFEQEKGDQAIQKAIHTMDAVKGDIDFIAWKTAKKVTNLRSLMSTSLSSALTDQDTSTKVDDVEGPAAMQANGG